MGIVVDAVSEVYNFSQRGSEAAAGARATAWSMRFARGLAAVGESLVIVLDIDHILGGLGERGLRSPLRTSGPTSQSEPSLGPSSREI